MRTISRIGGVFFIIAAFLLTAGMGYSTVGKVSQEKDNGDFAVHYNVRNTGDDDITNSRMIVWIPELDVYARSNNFNLKKNNIRSGIVFPLEGYEGSIEPGYYLTRIKFSSDHSKASQWIWVWVE